MAATVEKLERSAAEDEADAAALLEGHASSVSQRADSQLSTDEPGARRSTRARVWASLAAACAVVGAGACLMAALRSDPVQPAATAAPLARGDLAQLAQLWQQTWSHHPLFRAAFEEARAAFPKTGEPLRGIPWPTLSGPLLRSNRSGPLPKVLVSQVSVDGGDELPHVATTSAVGDVWQAFSPDAVLASTEPLNASLVEEVFGRRPRRLNGGGGGGFIVPKEARGDLALDTSVCFFDAYQSVQYLAYAGLGIYYTYRGFETNQSAGENSANILGLIATVSWVASYLASAATSCQIGLPDDATAACASNAIWLEGNFPQLAADALGVVEDCHPSNFSINLSRADDLAGVLQNASSDRPGRGGRGRAGRAKHGSDGVRSHLSALERRLRGNRGARIYGAREAAIVSCSFDIQAAISFFARFGIQVAIEMKDCLDLSTAENQRTCAWGVLYAIENFGWAVEYLIQMVNDCPLLFNNKALCAEDIMDLVMTGSSIVPAAAWVKEYCVEPKQGKA